MMTPALEELIALAIDGARAEPKSREMALVLTKLDEARLWLADARRTAKETTHFAGRSD